MSMTGILAAEVMASLDYSDAKDAKGGYLAEAESAWDDAI